MKAQLCIYLLSTQLRSNAALYKLAVWANRFTPLVGINQELDGLMLDLSGTQKLHKDQQTLAQQIHTELAAYNISIKIAVAPTVGAAYALAKYGAATITVITRAELRAALAMLKLQALRLPDDTIRALNQIGIYSIAELLKLPRKELGIRFGILPLKRLDQALGLVDETFISVQAAESLLCKKTFEVPLTRQAHVESSLLFLLRRVLEKLARRNSKARSFQITLELILENGNPALLRKELQLHSATFDFSHLSSIIGPILESLALSGQVRSISINPKDLELNSYQQSSLDSSHVPSDIKRLQDELLNTLSIRLGAANLRQLQVYQSYTPERSFSYADLDQAKVSTEAIINIDRPPHLFARPEPCQVVSLLPDHPPSRLEWRGKLYAITQGCASEKISAEWWHKELRLDAQYQIQERHYFRVQDQSGRWLWLFRTNKLRWFVHGVWA